MNYSWLPDYFRSILRRPRKVHGTQHLMFCVADHFEPFGWRQEREKNLARVDEWIAAYPRAVKAFRDADGFSPRHTFFCSEEAYEPGYIEKVKRLVTEGYGEIEIHLHHRNDTPDGFQSKLVNFRDALHNRHGLLGTRNAECGTRNGCGTEGTRNLGYGSQQRCRDSQTFRVPSSAFRVPGPAYGFVHGNWALCNARPDGDWCGVNEELAILARTGCYADFTFPSAPDPTQPRIVNSIYRAVDNPEGRGQEFRTRNSERGTRKAEQDAGCGMRGTECEHPTSNIEHRTSELTDPQHSNTPTLHHSNPSLLLITGPLALNWRRRKWGVLPCLENGDISKARPPTPQRADLWVKQHIHVQGRPEWVFVKVYTHGIVPYNMDAILGKPMQRTHEHLCARYNDGKRWMLHYVTAREMGNIVRAAEDGKEGNPAAYRDYEIAPPACVGRRTRNPERGTRNGEK